jgi:hypothetical protein
MEKGLLADFFYKSVNLRFIVFSPPNQLYLLLGISIINPMSEKSGIDLISFLQDHTQLFTITALFAALSYYLANLLIAPRDKYLGIVYDLGLTRLKKSKNKKHPL